MHGAGSLLAVILLAAARTLQDSTLSAGPTPESV